MSTIKDIAKACHVSISTVSRALNGYEDINYETKQIILNMAKEMEYIPNKNARQLVKKNNNNLVIITKTLENEHNLYHILRGLYNYADEIDYEVSLYTLGSSIKKGKSYYQFCKENNIEGALLYGIHTDDPYIQEIVDKKFPSVIIDCDITGEKTANISIDNYKAAYESVDYLIKSGREKIVTIQGGEGSYVTKERVRGYTDALIDNNIIINKEMIIYEGFTDKLSVKCCEKILNADGIFCGGDIIAAGVYKVLREKNINIPQEISVLGFGDIEIGKYLTPTLTTVRQSMYNFGYEGGKALYSLIKGKDISKVIRLEYKFIKRESI